MRLPSAISQTVLVQDCLCVKWSIINVIKHLFLQNLTTDLAEIWSQLLPDKDRPSSDFGLGLVSEEK